MKKHSKEEKRTHTHTPCIQQPARTIQAAEHPIKSCVFVSQETIAYVPESYKVSIIMIIVIILCKISMGSLLLYCLSITIGDYLQHL